MWLARIEPDKPDHDLEIIWKKYAAADVA